MNEFDYADDKLDRLTRDLRTVAQQMPTEVFDLLSDAQRESTARSVRSARERAVEGCGLVRQFGG